MNSKLKLVVELNDFNDVEELIGLVTSQVHHLWGKWDKNSTDDQKILMEMLAKNPKELPADFDTYFNNESDKVMFLLRTKEMFWKYKNSLERLKDLQKACDKFNYNRDEPFEEIHYGLNWDNN